VTTLSALRRAAGGRAVATGSAPRYQVVGQGGVTRRVTPGFSGRRARGAHAGHGSAFQSVTQGVTGVTAPRVTVRTLSKEGERDSPAAVLPRARARGGCVSPVACSEQGQPISTRVGE
jgi:phage tail tape-measure protein